MAVDIKMAVQVAVQHVQSLIGNVQDVRLEEIVPGPNDGWLVTISFLARDVGGVVGKREYKEIEINNFGQPVAMRIKQVA